MIVFAIVILIILILRFNLDETRVGTPDYELETKFLRVICLILVLIAGLRGRDVGTDTFMYVDDYEIVHKSSLSQVIEAHGSIGAGYYWFAKVFSMTGLSVHWWFTVVALFYTYSIYSFIQVYSKDKLISILCFLTIGLFTFSLAGLKQTMAMGFTALAYIQFDKKKYITVAILAFLAYWCHTATVIFLFGVMLFLFRNRKLFFPLLISVFIVIVFWGDWLWQTSIASLENEHYLMYADADNLYSAWTFIFYVLLMVIMLFPVKNYVLTNSNEAKTFYGMSVLAMSFQSLATSFSTAFRVAYYFLPFMIVLIPNCCNYFNDKTTKRLFLFTLSSSCIFWMLYTGREAEYTFFWQR